VQDYPRKPERFVDRPLGSFNIGYISIPGFVIGAVGGGFLGAGLSIVIDPLKDMSSMWPYVVSGAAVVNGLCYGRVIAKKYRSHRE
jgi:hypothetical protein